MSQTANTKRKGKADPAADLRTRFRDNVLKMEAYVPGEQPPAGSKVIKLNTNENPYPPSPHVAEAIRNELASEAVGESLRVYSDPQALALREAAARQYGFEVEQVLHGNGSDELLAILMRSVIRDGDVVAYPYPTYSLYETLANAQGATIQTFDSGSDFELPKGLFTCDAKLVFIARPNSPSGTVCSLDRLSRLAKSLSNGILVVDEAYADFADSNALSLVDTHANVIVLRTFSKSHSLAGMRLGLLFGHAEIIRQLWKVKDSYNLDRLAILAGAASLEDPEWIQRNCKKIKQVRVHLVCALEALGLQVVPSEANFVFVRFENAKKAEEVYQGLKAKGILVRYFPMRLLDDGLRITVGTQGEINVLLKTLKEYVTGG